MKAKIVKQIEVDIKYLDVFFGGRFYPEDLEINNESFEELDDIFNKYPSLKNINPDGYEDLWLRIDVDTGEVVNWPKTGMEDCYLHSIKIVDEGIYVLINSHGEHIETRGYVPSCLEIDDNGYGDYFEFTIQSNGKIKDWNFTQKHLDDLLNKTF